MLCETASSKALSSRTFRRPVRGLRRRHHASPPDQGRTEELTVTLFTKAAARTPARRRCPRARHRLRRGRSRPRPSTSTLRAVSGRSTTPQVFVNGDAIGGADELANWLEVDRARGLIHFQGAPPRDAPAPEIAAMPLPSPPGRGGPFCLALHAPCTAHPHNRRSPIDQVLAHAPPRPGRHTASAFPGYGPASRPRLSLQTPRLRGSDARLHRAALDRDRRLHRPWRRPPASPPATAQTLRRLRERGQARRPCLRQPPYLAPSAPCTRLSSVVEQRLRRIYCRGRPHRHSRTTSGSCSMSGTTGKDSISASRPICLTLALTQSRRLPARSPQAPPSSP